MILPLGRLRSWVVVLWCAGVATLASAASLPDFSAIVASQGAAVVNISTTATAPALSSLPELPDIESGEEWMDLLRRFLPQLPEPPGEGNPSLGSGFIISPDGYILTNAHVVSGADEIVVRLVDKREFNATVVGTDLRSDVAVIRIEASGLPIVRLGNPERLKVGEWVLAIGSPFGFEHTVTAGIVSAMGRALPDENFVPFIQTDVAINPGNSGGPLFNLRGEVIGINAQIYSETGGFMGLSFAIPIDVAMDIYQQLRKDGQVRRGRIGVAVQEVTRALAESFGLNSTDGALVGTVEPDSPAERAGVQVGDVVVRFGGKPVPGSTALPRIVAGHRPGSETAMVLMREGKSMELNVTVGEWSEPTVVVPKEPAPSPERVGLVLSDPTPEERRDGGGARGLVVESVEGPAARSELRPGDVILSSVANGHQTALETVAQFEQVVSGLTDGQVLTLLVERPSGASFVSIRVGG